MSVEDDIRYIERKFKPQNLSRKQKKELERELLEDYDAQETAVFNLIVLIFVLACFAIGFYYALK